MPAITLYRQARFDGGVRTGIDIDGNSVLMDYSEGDSDDNPALLWYIDLRCEGETLPADPEEARKWLRRAAPAFKSALIAAADELRVGFDPEFHPFRRGIQLPQADAHAEIVVSAIRIIDGRKAAELLRAFAAECEEILAKVSPLVNA